MLIVGVTPRVTAAQEGIGAQQVDSLRNHYLLLPPAATGMVGSRAAPGSSAATPIAFGAAWGDGYIGLGLQARTRYSHGKRDGGIVTGFGIGDAHRLVGLDVTMTSLSTLRSGLFKRTAVSFKVHRILSGALGIAVGVENPLILGGGKTDGVTSWYGVASKLFQLRDEEWRPFGSIIASAGLGNGRFRAEEDDIAAKSTVNLFGSIGFRLARPVSAIADWSGQDLTLALSIVPLRCFPLVLTPGWTDVTGSAGDGARFTVGAGLGFRFAALANVEVPQCF